MSMSSLRLWTQTRCSARLLRITSKSALTFVVHPKRNYATPNSMDFGEKSQLLSESMDSKQRSRSEPRHDNLGPFQLGLSQSALRKGEPVKKWSELSTGGKGAQLTCTILNPLLIAFSVYSMYHSCACYRSYHELGSNTPWSRPFGASDILPDL